MWPFTPVVVIKYDNKNIIIHNKKEALFYGKQWLKIVNDSARLVNTTCKPEVFFSRYTLLIELLENLKKLEVYRCFKSKPSKDLNHLNSNKIYTINDFIDRYYQNSLQKIQNLKTITSKENNIKKFEQNIEPYKKHMDEENIKYFYTKCVELKK